MVPQLEVEGATRVSFQVGIRSIVGQREAVVSRRLVLVAEGALVGAIVVAEMEPVRCCVRVGKSHHPESQH